MIPNAKAPERKRILIGQLIANGDCLYATTVAWQIKTDHPDCHLTWAISSRCRQILRHNPHVDEVWELKLEQGGELFDHWAELLRLREQLRREAALRKARGDFDEVYLTQADPARIEHYDGTVRSFVLSAYPRPITVPVNPVIRLDAQEVANAERFLAAHPVIGCCRHVLLFECSPKSGQSFVNPSYALEVGRELIARREDVCLLLSSNLPIETGDERIIDASTLSFRENAEITKSCTLLVGCSSGISWLCTSDWAKPLPTVQLLKSSAPMPNSFVHDRERQDLPTDTILEMIDCPVSHARDCLLCIFENGFADARARFHQRISLTWSYDEMLRALLFHRLYGAGVRFMLRAVRREWPAPWLLLHMVWVAMRFLGRPLKDAVRRLFVRDRSRDRYSPPI